MKVYKRSVENSMLVATEAIKNVQTTIRARLVNEVLNSELDSDTDDIKQDAINELNFIYGSMTECLKHISDSGLINKQKIKNLNNRKEKEILNRRPYD